MKSSNKNDSIEIWKKYQNSILPNKKRKEKKRITILSDTHDPLEIQERSDKMKSLDGDINIHIGDVFDSKIRSEILSTFKLNPESAVEELNNQEKEIFNHIVEDGNVPIRAYWMAKVQVNPELFQNIKIELDEAYEIFANTFKELPKAKWLYGNVEQGYSQNADFQDTKLVNEKITGVEKVETPQVFHEDKASLGILFPSLPKNEEVSESVVEFFSKLENKIKDNADFKNIIIIAHEYLFRGLPPEKFKEKMKKTGIDKYHIPFYLPNNYRREILDFIFKIPEEIEVKFIYGHIHDPKKITQEGIAFKHSDDKIGMRWSVNKRDEKSGKRRTRHFDMYQMPFQSIYTIDITNTDIKINKQE